MAKSERISPVDTAWLRMDRPGNLMMIIGVMMFAAPIDIDRLKILVLERFARFDRFRQRVSMQATGAYWEDDEQFDIDFHVKRIALPRPADQEALQNFVAEQATTPLDPNRPLWQFMLVENFVDGAAVVVRIHHCIADGIALMGVLLSITDESPEDHVRIAQTDATAENAGEEQPDFWQRLVSPVGGVLSGAVKAYETTRDTIESLWREPDRLADYARAGGQIAGELAHLAAMPDDSPTRFKGKPGLVKRVAWSERIPLEEIKAVGKVLGCSVNDLLLASAAGALAEYLADKGDALEGVEVRVLVPVNLRDPASAHSLGNRFGLVELVLPLGVRNPMARLYEVRHRMQALKQRYQAPVTLGLLAALGVMPGLVQQQVLDLLARKATAVVTNVPGPRQVLYLAGARLTQLMFWVPQSGDIGIGISILSYAGSVQIGLITDRNFVPDPEDIVTRFRPEFEKVLYTLLLEPPAKEPGTKTARPKRARARSATKPVPSEKPAPRKRAAGRRSTR